MDNQDLDFKQQEERRPIKLSTEQNHSIIVVWGFVIVLILGALIYYFIR